LEIAKNTSIMTQREELIQKAYAAFNERDIDQVLTTMHPDVHWPNGWEGGYVNGHEEVRNYWTRQWKELDPYVEPTAFNELPDGRLEVKVHQIVKDVQGNLLVDGIVKHVYTFRGDLITTMEIEE
jgi:hypothetical protein